MKLWHALFPICLAIAFATAPSVAAAKPYGTFPLQAKRILFVGDSITHAGTYVAWIETQLRLRDPANVPQIVNIGLGSETCSGLSEPAHPFPRPDIHERLDRALEKIKPDLVVACYGMNDGIYYPFGEQRFAAYQRGVRLLVDKCHGAGAKVVLLTPPPFDPVPLEDSGKLKPAGEDEYAYFAMYEGYDDVLHRYGRWILEGTHGADMTIDIHTPLKQYAAAKRADNPKFTVTPDGIHPNAEGHEVLAKAVLQKWGVAWQDPPDGLFPLVRQKTVLLHDAWLSHVGHKRPGIKPGLPLDEAQAKAAELNRKIEQQFAATGSNQP